MAKDQKVYHGAAPRRAQSFGFYELEAAVRLFAALRAGKDVRVMMRAPALIKVERKFREALVKIHPDQDVLAARESAGER